MSENTPESYKLNPDLFINQVLELNRLLKIYHYKPDEICQILGVHINTMRHHRSRSWLTLDVSSVHKLMINVAERIKQEDRAS